MVLLCCIIGLFAYTGKMQINSAPSARIYPSTKTYYLRRFKDELFSYIKVDIRYIRIGAGCTDCGRSYCHGDWLLSFRVYACPACSNTYPVVTQSGSDLRFCLGSTHFLASLDSFCWLGTPFDCSHPSDDLWLKENKTLSLPA